MKGKLFLYFFFVAAVVQVISILSDWSPGHIVSKVLLLPALAAYYVAVADFRSRPFLAAVFFCWLGDVLLLWPSLFIGGLSAFLLGHVAYILAYRQHQNEERTAELLPTQKIRYSLPIVLAGTGLIVVLFPALDSLKLPVTVYGIVIMLMVMAALFRYGRTVTSSFQLVLGGAILFMISDSILAVNKFLTPVSSASLWIMLTYMCAQLMIVVGISRHR